MQGPFLVPFTKAPPILVSEKIRGLIRGRCGHAAGRSAADQKMKKKSIFEEIKKRL